MFYPPANFFFQTNICLYIKQKEEMGVSHLHNPSIHSTPLHITTISIAPKLCSVKRKAQGKGKEACSKGESFGVGFSSTLWAVTVVFIHQSLSGFFPHLGRCFQAFILLWAVPEVFWVSFCLTVWKERKRELSENDIGSEAGDYRYSDSVNVCHAWKHDQEKTTLIRFK